MTMEHAPTNEAPSVAEVAPVTQPVSAPEASSFSVPDAYADKGWTEKVKSTDDLWKTTANLQEMIGKRPAGIPSADSSDADWDNFYKAAGRPEEAKYEFTDPEGLPEDFDTAGFKQSANEILHSAGLSQKQAEKVYNAYMALELKGSADKEAALDEKFDALTKEHLGDGYEAAQQATLDAVNRFAPQSLKNSLSALSVHPEALAAVVATINGQQLEIDKVRKEYGAEGTISSGNQVGSGGDINETRNNLAELRTSIAARDFSHPDHSKTMEQVKQLTGVVDRHYAKK